MENVAGLNFSGKEEGYQFILNELTRINERTGMRYQLSSKVINAAWYGVPQTRERIILVGSREGIPFVFPERMFHDAKVPPDYGAKGEPYRTAWDALGDAEASDDPDELRVRGRWAKLLPSIPEGGNYLHHTDRGNGVPIFGWRRRYWSFLLKLAKNRPSWTLTAQPGPAIGPFHWKSRRLSRTELARLQTFPEGYLVKGSLADAQRQIGNAVPSLLGEVLTREIRSQLLGQRVEGHIRLQLSKRGSPPPPERRRPVPQEYQNLAGAHAAHPGTGLGYSASRRQDAAPA
jgi:DNA (cytosine-5)-methyltransferase 1